MEPRDGSPSRPHARAPRRYDACPPTVAQARPFTILSTNPVSLAAAPVRTNQFAWRLSNTTKTIGELVNDRHAILLANALIDTSAKLNLSIPKQLQAPGEPGAYIVQANGPIDNAFRAMLAQSGAQIVSYIPNNAYLVTLSASGANALAADGFHGDSLRAVLQGVGVAAAVDRQIAARRRDFERGVVSRQRAAGDSGKLKPPAEKCCRRKNRQNGWIVNVQPPADWTVVPALPGVHIVEPSYRRAAANDLSRATVGVAVDTQMSTNYLEPVRLERAGGSERLGH